MFYRAAGPAILLRFCEATIARLSSADLTNVEADVQAGRMPTAHLKLAALARRRRLVCRPVLGQRRRHF